MGLYTREQLYSFGTNWLKKFGDRFNVCQSVMYYKCIQGLSMMYVCLCNNKARGLLNQWLTTVEV